MSGRSAYQSVACVVVCLVISGCTMFGKKEIGSSLDGWDQKFIRDAADGSMADVAEARIALENANSPQVKQYAQRMIDEHESMNDMIKELADKKALSIPQAADEQHHEASATLSNLAGAEFDKSYMAGQVSGHAKMVAMFEDASQNAKDPEVRAFAQNQLEGLKEHLAKARSVRDSLGGPKSD